MHEDFFGPEHMFRSKLEQRVVFFFVVVGIVSITYGFFFLIDFLPEEPSTEVTQETEKALTETAPLPVKEEAPTPEVAPIDPLPSTIILDSLDREIRVLNPDSEDVAVLDNALLQGVVRHPGSADFERTGTIFLLGHSSYLPKVNNKNFQAFNGIQKLKWGDTIRLRSSDTEYVYAVKRVYEAKASDAEVKIEEGTPTLTLATCNSFGTKDDRFVVEASLVSTKALSS